MRNRIGKFLSLLVFVVIITIVPGMAGSEENVPLLRSTITSVVTVRNGESTTVTVYYENTGNANLVAWTENSKIAQASFESRTDGVAKVKITGYGTGVTKTRVYLKDNSDVFVDIAIKVTPSQEELFKLKAVEYLSDRDFFYYDDKEMYVILFSLKNKENERVKAPVTVVVKIVNDNNETVYEETHYVTMNDFGMWTSSLYGERLLASIYIDPDEIEKGTTRNGAVNFTVKQPGYLSFDEMKITTTDLPKTDETENCSLILPALPQLLVDKYLSDKVYSRVKITEMSYEFEENIDGSVDLHIYYVGQKLYDYKGKTNNDSCKIGWKLYDSEGYVIKSGTTYTVDLEMDEKFKGCEEIIYNLEPGTYRLKILDVE